MERRAHCVSKTGNPRSSSSVEVTVRRRSAPHRKTLYRRHSHAIEPISVHCQVVGSLPAYGTAGTDIDVASLSVSFTLNRPTLSVSVRATPGAFSGKRTSGRE